MSDKLEKVVTIRFSRSAHNEISYQAKVSNMQIGELIREACNFYFEQKRLTQYLTSMERRQTNILIEVMAAMLDLSECKKDKIIEYLLENGVQI